MDLFMPNIPTHVKDYDLIRKIASVLHSDGCRAIQPGPPVNFKVYLRKPRHNRSLVGNLVIPYENVGNYFLGIVTYGHTRIVISNRPISFQKNNINGGRADEGTVEYLKSTPYVDPVQKEREDEMNSKFGSGIPLKFVQFGSLTVDFKFLPAFKFIGRSIYLFMDPINKEISIRDSTTRCSMIFRRTIVEDVYFDEGSKRAIFTLRCPPRYLIPRSSTEEKFDRVFALSNIHVLTAPFANRHILLSFSDQSNTISNFFDISKTFQLPRFREWIPKVISEDHFSRDTLLKLEAWLGTLRPRLAFQIERIFRNGFSSPLEVLEEKMFIRSLCIDVGEEKAAHIIGALGRDVQLGDWDSKETGLRRKLESIWKGRHRMRLRKQHREELFKFCHIIVTPSSFLMEGPEIDQSNDILRRFPDHQDHFIRLSFREEDLSSVRFTHEIDHSKFIRTCFLPMLKDGIRVMGRSFNFLGYSNSGLKDHGVWFMTSFKTSDGILHDAESIRKSLGTFHKCKNQPALYGARIAQFFTATVPTIKLDWDQIYVIEDISNGNNLFTDGVGTISPKLASKIYAHHQDVRQKEKRRTPSVFQFRLGGYKGVVTVDHYLSGEQLCLRPSQEKFTSPDSLDFNVASTSQAMPMFLNRPLIQILEHLGANSNYIRSLQEKAVKDISSICTGLLRASETLREFRIGNSFNISSLLRRIKLILQLDFKSTMTSNLIQDPFIKQALNLATADILREMKHRARIPVPGSYTLMGVADEWDILEEGEIYAAVRLEPYNPLTYISGDVAITRSPVTHVGDVQIVHAVSPSELPSNCPILKLENCVVFSCRGKRSIPSCLGGGDLDGDIYNLLVDKRLHPKSPRRPSEYPTVKRLTLQRESTIEDVADFVTDFFASDVLGVIGTTLLAIGDRDPASAESVRLAKLYQQAVDFPKSGIPCKLDLPRLETRPDFLRPEYLAEAQDRQYYNSKRLLGQLFRSIPESDMHYQLPKKKKVLPKSFQVDFTYCPVDSVSVALRRSLGRTLIHMRDSEIEQEMFEIWSYYALELEQICAEETLSHRNKPLSEEEAFMGVIIARIPDRRVQQLHVSKLRLKTEELVRETKRAVEGDEEDDDEEKVLRAWYAWVMVHQLENSTSGKPVLFGVQSFSNLVLGLFLECLQGWKEF